MEQPAYAMVATILRKTSLDETLVLLFLGLVMTVGILGLYRKIRVAAHNKAFWGIVVALLATSACIFFIDPKTFDAFSGESHVVEWLTADMLLLAWVIGLLAVLRLRARKKPYPLTLFLTVGYMVAFFRELEWGEPLFGEKIVYTRYMFRPKAYFDPSRFNALAREIGLSEQFLHTSLLVFLGLVIVIGTITITYLVRHRKVFVEELLVFYKKPWGRYFMMGFGLYLASQLTGELVEEVLEDQLAAIGTSYCVIAEPLELIASMLLMRSMMALWHGQRCYLPAAVLRARAVAASTIPTCGRTVLQPQHTGLPG